MTGWKKMRIGAFLIEREGHFNPDDRQLKDLPRLNKIDFSGTIHLSAKPTKTSMIIVHPGDLVISGINVSKGAIAIWQGDHPITATIHYSSYTFNEKIIDIAFLKRYLKSPTFIKSLQDQVKGGIKTEIKSKHLLRLDVCIPPLDEQIEINHYFESFEKELTEISAETSAQMSLLTQVREAIFQEAIEGRLTAEWRMAHPLCKGDPEYDAEALLAKIEADKKKYFSEGKIKAEKTLAPMSPADIPFEVPKSWVWKNLAAIIRNPPKNGYSPREVSYKTNVKSLKLGATTRGYFDPKQYKYIDEIIQEDSVFWLTPNDILIQRSNSLDYVGVSAIYSGEHREFIYPDLMMKIEVMSPLSIPFVHAALSAPFNREYFRKNAKGAQKSMPKINQSVVSHTLVPLPPLAEQRLIVARVEKLLGMVDLLESQVRDRKEQSDMLLQSVLREAFDSTKNR
jgi:type I restriction enzyme S subunit